MERYAAMVNWSCDWKISYPYLVYDKGYKGSHGYFSCTACGSASLVVALYFVSRLPYLFKENAWSNLAQEIRFWEFMGESIFAQAANN